MFGGYRKSTSLVAIAAATGLFMGGAAFAPAMAADLGGDCCADLEERVAELEATTVRKGNRKVSVKLSGQVNTGVLYWNDGVQSDVYVVDNVSSSSRFIISGSAKIHAGVSAGFHMEIEYTAGGTSSSVNQLDDDGGQNGDGLLDVRKNYWWIKSATLGQLSVGQNSPATDDLTLIELGGSGVVSTDATLFGGGVLITRNNTSATAAGTTMGNIFTGIDSTSRSNIVRYDTPTFAGFSVSAAWGEDDIWDVALKYAGEFGGIRVAAGIGYFESNDDTTGSVPGGAIGNNTTDKRFLGSASALHVPTGLFLTGYWNVGNDGAAANQDTLRWGLRGGISQKFTSLGKTVVFVDYSKAEVDNLAINFNGAALAAGNQEGDLWGVGVVQHIDAAAMELYLTYQRRSFDLKAGGATISGVNDHDIVFAGGRIKF